MTYEELAKNLDEKLSAMQGYTARDIQRSIETMKQLSKRDGK